MGYRRTVPTHGDVLQQSHTRTIQYRKVPVQYCTVPVSFVRPQHLRIAIFSHIAGNKKVAQDVKYMNGGSFREGYGFFFLGLILCAYALGTSASAEASFAYAAWILVL